MLLLSLSVDIITFERIIRLKCTLIHVIGVPKEGTSSFMRIIRPKFGKLTHFWCSWKTKSLSASRLHFHRALRARLASLSAPKARDAVVAFGVLCSLDTNCSIFTFSSWMRRYWFYVKNDFRNFHQIFTFWDPLSLKKWFLRKCFSVCLSVCRSCAA